MINRILLLCCIAFAAHAQRPLRWVADASQTAPVTFDCSRGETLTFTPTLKAYGVTLTNYTASFQWQTNGMGGLFWSTNVLVFSPSMDVGANRYRFWIRAESTNGVIYSANGTINMLHAPGAIVNSLPLPVQQIDFSAVSSLNAPWLSATDATYTATVSRAFSAYGWGPHASAGYLHQGESLFISEPGGGVLFPSESDAYALWLAYSGFRDSNDYFINLPPFSNISQTLATWQWTRSYVATNQPDLSGYLPLAGGELAENATLTLRDLYLYTTHSVNGVALSSPPFGIAATLNYPQDLQGTFTLATREWTRDYVSTGAPPSGLSGAQVTNIVESAREFHIDSYTNIIWRSVYSNGWTWLVAYTNYPAN